MTRNLKSMGLAMFAALALGALSAQGASAAKSQEFRSDGLVVGTGEAAMNLQVGAVGTVTCTGEFEDTSEGSWNGKEYTSDTLTVTARFKECTFGGQAATVNTNHCAFIVDSDLTERSGSEEEWANAEIECAESQKIEIHTSLCTVTVGAQLVKHAINYPPDTEVSLSGNVSAEKIVVGKVRTTAGQPVNGCLTFPTGAVGTATGAGTTACLKDQGSTLIGTDKTTPQGKTSEGASTKCSIE